MKTNIQALMNLISEEERYLNNRTYTIKTYALNTTVEELDGRVNIIEDNKEAFDLDFEALETSVKKLSKLKSVLYQKNNEFIVYGQSIVKKLQIHGRCKKRIHNKCQRYIL